QLECWDDAARLADAKWDRVMGEVWPEAQRHVAEELGSGRPDAVVFAANTHDFLIRLAAAAPRRADKAMRVLTTDGEFHSARRQFARWVEGGEIEQTIVPTEPFGSLSERFLANARTGDFDLIVISQLLFGSGQVFGEVEELARYANPAGPWVVVDGYHSFMAMETPLSPLVADRVFFLAGGYKYAMAGEGMGLMHCPPSFGERPPITGWFAEFEDLTLPRGQIGYAKDAMRFMGATFDPSALYRWNGIRRMLAGEGLTTAVIGRQVERLQHILLEKLAETPLADAELLNPLNKGPHARFLALRHPRAAEWQAALKARDCITDVRGDVLRIGLGLYHDDSDIHAFAELAAGV
ncbi:MAG TPA: aminotransferase class V-fold PLP-dependent enzyme, partial [Sphingomicrobium sp.]|nr:aminotransferase class V-fold PLP-dependent enzyme [Sphingomicrobium sp.]